MRAKRSCGGENYSSISISSEVTCWLLDTEVELKELCFTTLEDMTLCVTDCCTDRCTELLDSTTELPSTRTSLEDCDSWELVLDFCTSD